MATSRPTYIEENRCERINGETAPRPASGDTHSDVQENVRRLVPYARTKAGQLIPPGFLAGEVVPPKEGGLFDKAETYVSWGVHGGEAFIKAKEALHA